MKFAIIGSGIRGQMYAESLRDHPDARVTAVCDLDADSAAALAARTGADAYSDHRAMLSAAAPDAVIVATPDFAHREAAVDAAASGADLLIEKPLATTADDVAAIARAVADAGVACLVGFENRWNPAIRQLHDLRADGTLGDVITQNILLSNTYYVPTTMISWAAKSSPAWFLMSHTVDAAMWVAGKTVTSVHANGSRGRLAARGVDTWDVIHALLTFDDGTTANLTSSWVMPESTPSIVDFQYKVIGSHAAADVNLQDQGVHLAGESYSWPGTVGGVIDGRLQGPPTWMVRSFADRLASGEDVGPGIETAALVSDVVLAILSSLERGESVPVTSSIGAENVR